MLIASHQRQEGRNPPAIPPARPTWEAIPQDTCPIPRPLHMRPMGGLGGRLNFVISVTQNCRGLPKAQLREEWGEASR